MRKLGFWKVIFLNLLFAKTLFSFQIYVLKVGLKYKPELKPYVEKELSLLKKHWGNYTVLKPEDIAKKVFRNGDIVVVLGEYTGFKLFIRGKPDWLILDYCQSCRSIDLEQTEAKNILCSQSRIPAYGFYYLYATSLPLTKKKIYNALRKTLEEFGYRGELGKIRIRLYRRDR